MIVAYPAIAKDPWLNAMGPLEYFGQTTVGPEFWRSIFWPKKQQALGEFAPRAHSGARCEHDLHWRSQWLFWGGQKCRPWESAVEQWSDAPFLISHCGCQDCAHILLSVRGDSYTPVTPFGLDGPRFVGEIVCSRSDCNQMWWFYSEIGLLCL